MSCNFSCEVSALHAVTRHGADARCPMQPAEGADLADGGGGRQFNTSRLRSIVQYTFRNSSISTILIDYQLGTMHTAVARIDSRIFIPVASYYFTQTTTQHPLLNAQ